MSGHDHQEDPAELEHAKQLGYDHRDWAFGKIGMGSTYGLIFLCVFGLIATWAFMMIYDRTSLQAEPAARQTMDPRRDLPPAPLLQSNVTVKKDIKELRDREAATLDSYAVVDEAKGKVRVPISVAMDEIAAKGTGSLAAQPATNAKPGAVTK